MKNGDREKKNDCSFCMYIKKETLVFSLYMLAKPSFNMQLVEGLGAGSLNSDGSNGTRKLYNKKSIDAI